MAFVSVVVPNDIQSRSNRLLTRLDARLNLSTLASSPLPWPYLIPNVKEGSSVIYFGWLVLDQMTGSTAIATASAGFTGPNFTDWSASFQFGGASNSDACVLPDANGAAKQNPTVLQNFTIKVTVAGTGTCRASVWGWTY